jgi:mono/diheme cytochrome c family protein
MRPVFVVAAVAVLAAGGTVGFAYSGLFDVSASATEPGVVRWLLQTTRESSVRRRAADIAAPDLSDETLVAAGGRAFGEMCAGCHGAPGRKPLLGVGDMNPPPPDLVKAAAERTPAELFWMIKHGIRMTGMPAWGATHSDAQLWDLVAFLERLPELTAVDYRRLAERSGDNGHGHDHGGPVQTEPEGHEPGGHVH